jgi:hypothetical protein
MELTLRQMTLSYVGTPFTNAAASAFACWVAQISTTFPRKKQRIQGIDK